MSDSKDRRNYEDLKAKLGLKKAQEAAPAAAPVSAEVGEPVGSQTPPGGFDLGLERGGQEMDSALIDMEKAVAELSSGGGGELAVRMSTGTKLLITILALVALVAAAGLGWVSADTRSKRIIADQQQGDAEKLLKAMETSLALPDPSAPEGKAENLGLVVEAQAALITAAANKILSQDVLDELAKSRSLPGHQMPSKMLERQKKALLELRIVCQIYAEREPVFDAKNVIGSAIFNGEAVKAIMDYEIVLRKLLAANRLFANEKVVFDEFQMKFKGRQLVAPNVVKHWRYYETKDKQGVWRGVLLDTRPLLGEDGKPREEQVEVPSGDPKSPLMKQWRRWIRYEKQLFSRYGAAVADRLGASEPKERFFCKGAPAPKDSKEPGGKVDARGRPVAMTCDHLTPTGALVENDFKADVAKVAKGMLEQEQHYYELRLLERLLRRLEQLRDAAKPVVNVRENVLKKLRKLAHAE